MVLDLRLTHDCWGNTSNPLFNENLYFPRPDDIDRPLNKTDPDKIRGYRTDDNNRPSNWKTLKGIRGVSEAHLVYEVGKEINTDNTATLWSESRKVSDRDATPSWNELIRKFPDGFPFGKDSKRTVSTLRKLWNELHLSCVCSFLIYHEVDDTIT